MSLYEVLLLYTPVEVFEVFLQVLGLLIFGWIFTSPGRFSEITGLETGKDWLHNKIQIKSQPLWLFGPL